MHEIAPSSLERVVSRVRRLSTSSPVGFWFLTDLHVPSNHGKSASLLADLIAETGLRTVVCGGDIPEAFGDRAALDDSIDRYRRHWVDVIERAGGAFFPVHGNHDLAIRTAPDAVTGFTYPAGDTRAVLLDVAAVREHAIVDPGSCAYYADFPEMHMRLVVADTSDSVTDERPYWGVVDSVGEAQLLWLAEHALDGVPEGWGVVIVSHIPIAGVGASEADRRNGAPLRTLLDAYQARGRAMVFGREIDFSHVRGRLLLALSGHHHAELQSCVSGLWHVTEPCDAAYLDYINRSKPWCVDLPVKEAGTWAGQTFDAVQIDPLRGLAHFTRVGGGSDRTLRLDARVLHVGETAVFAAQELDSPVRWGAFDADMATPRANPARKYDYFTDYTFRVGEMSPDGRFTARVPGESVAVATAPDGEREYVPVTVR